MAKKLKTSYRKFVGANIKGTPRMSRGKVGKDLRVIRNQTDAVGLIEFKWLPYWLSLAVVFRAVKWGSFPRHSRGAAQPIWAAQALVWKRSIWKARFRMTRLLHKKQPGISENRYLRAVLLEDRATKLSAWHGVGHFVVGGDDDRDEPVRRVLLKNNIEKFFEFIDELRETSQPILFYIDGNIKPGTQAYNTLVQGIRQRGGTLHGEHGVEYMMTFPGDFTVIEAPWPWRIPVAQLNTDHEARGLTYRIIER